MHLVSLELDPDQAERFAKALLHIIKEVRQHRGTRSMAHDCWIETKTPDGVEEARLVVQVRR